MAKIVLYFQWREMHNAKGFNQCVLNDHLINIRKCFSNANKS